MKKERVKFKLCSSRDYYLFHFLFYSVLQITCVTEKYNHFDSYGLGPLCPKIIQGLKKSELKHTKYKA